jgi:hypothetical protein
MSGDPSSEFVLPSDQVNASDESEGSPSRYKVTEEEADELGDTDASSGVKLPLDDEVVFTARQKARLAKRDFGKVLEQYRYTAVIDLAFQDSKDNGHPFHSEHPHKHLSDWRRSGTCLLGDIPLYLLQSLLSGTLDGKFKAKDPSLYKYFTEPTEAWMIRKVDQFAPIHYVRIFGDENGKSPSANELYCVVEDLEKYVSEDKRYNDICADIESYSTRGKGDADAISQGLHHFFNGSMKRPEKLIGFITALRAYLDTIAPDQLHEPIPDWFKYVGFTVRIGKRTEAHDNDSSSWLMSLFDTVCKRLFKQLDGKPRFWFEMYVVAFPINRFESHIGEELFCRMCKSYYYNGLGFNIQSAGKSKIGPMLDQLSEAKAADAWQARVTFRDQNEDFLAQVTEDIQRFTPKWEKVLRYHMKPEERRKRDIASVDAQVAKILDAGRSGEQVEADMRAMEERHQNGLEEVEETVVRAAVAMLHQRVEDKLWGELGTASDMST